MKTVKLDVKSSALNEPPDGDSIQMITAHTSKLSQTIHTMSAICCDTRTSRHIISNFTLPKATMAEPKIWRTHQLSHLSHFH